MADGDTRGDSQRLQQILDTYTFVGDFSPKSEDRKVSEIPFWRYPIKPPRVLFPINKSLGSNQEIESTKGSGRAYEHLNRGFMLFQKGSFEEAKKTWLSLRAKWGETYPHQRRTDYYLS